LWEKIIGLMLQNNLKDSICQAVNHKVELFMESHDYILPSSQDMLRFVDATRTEQQLAKTSRSNESDLFQVNLASQNNSSVSGRAEDSSVKA
jgi:hypothetical protein